jgi:S1-C subfamily serine protease
VDGDKVTVPEDLSGLVMAKEPGDVLALEIQRGDFQRTVNVTLGRRPSEPAG